MVFTDIHMSAYHIALFDTQNTFDSNNKTQFTIKFYDVEKDFDAESTFYSDDFQPIPLDFCI